MEIKRKIEFRGIPFHTEDVETYGEFVYGDLIQDAEYNCPRIRFFCDDIDKGGIDYISVFVIPESVGQNTGFVDSKGNQIYEGDVLSYCHEELTVEYFNGAFYGRRKDGTIHLIDMLYYLKPALQSKWTVTGNVCKTISSVE